MDLKECYAALGGNYESALGRLHSERLVNKFVLMFLRDGSFELLQKSLAEQDYQEAFRAAHTIKGMCQNLSFDKLQASASELTESLRNGWSEGVPGYLAQVEADYRQTVAAIQALDQ